MKTARLMAVLVTLLFSMSVGSVFANGYSQVTPIIGSTSNAAIGAPPANGAAPLITGTIHLTYSDGAPVVLATDNVKLQLCNSNMCITVDTTLTPEGLGAYGYSLTQPSLAGAVTITIPAYALVEDINGKQFPSVDTTIGSFVTTSSSSSGQETRQTAVTPVPQQSSYLYNQAVPAAQPNQQSPVFPILLAATILLLAAGGLVIIPSRKKNAQ